MSPLLSPLSLLPPPIQQHRGMKLKSALSERPTPQWKQ
jgi:hypothetical protein